MEEKEYSLRKREQNFKFVQFFLGTFVLGLCTWYTTYKIQEEDTQSAIAQAEAQRIGSFLDKYMSYTSTDDKLNFITFMSKISASDEVRERYDSLYAYVANLENVRQHKQQELDQQQKENTVLQEFNRKANILETGKIGDSLVSKEQLKETENELNTLMQKPEVQTALKLQKKIDQVEEQLSPFEALDTPIKSMNDTDEIFSDEWVKEDRYNPYGEYYLALNKLDKDEQSATFQLRKSPEFNPSALADFTLTAGKTKTVIDKASGKKITITMKKIDSAGKNPLTKAVYYDLVISAYTGTSM